MKKHHVDFPSILLSKVWSIEIKKPSHCKWQGQKEGFILLGYNPSKLMDHLLYGSLPHFNEENDSVCHISMYFLTSKQFLLKKGQNVQQKNLNQFKSNMAKKYLPLNLNLEAIILKNPPSFKYHIDNFIYILSLINEIPAKNKGILDDSKFTPINSTLLQKKVRNYMNYISYLMENNIIETDNQYIVGAKSRGFKFSEEFQTPIEPITIFKYSLVKEKNRVIRKNIVRKTYPYLTKWFNNNLNINSTAATEFLREEYNKNVEAGDENPIGKYNSGIINLEKLETKDFYYNVDDNVGRFHSNLTNIKSDLRKFITYGNDKLVSVDISNSQPYLSTLLLQERFYSIPIMPKKDVNFNIYQFINSNQYNNIYNKDIISKLSSYIMLVNNDITLDRRGFEPYIKLVESGDLYEYLKVQIQEKTGKKLEKKSDVKNMVFTVLYSDNRYIGLPEALEKRIFKELFPEVYEVFSLIKTGEKTALPRLLQTMESKLMLENISVAVAKEFPKKPIYTIHDSIVCVKGIENRVAEIVKSEALKFIGITPNLKMEYWDYTDTNLFN